MRQSANTDHRRPRNSRGISYTCGTGATQTAEVAGINTTLATLPCAGNYYQTQADVTATCVQTTFALRKMKY